MNSISSPSSPYSRTRLIEQIHYPAGVHFFTHALATYRCVLIKTGTSATFKRKPSEGVGHDRQSHKTLVQAIAYLRLNPHESPAEVSATASNDVRRVPKPTVRVPLGTPCHCLPRRSPPLGSALRTASSMATNTRKYLQLLDRGLGG